MKHVVTAILVATASATLVACGQVEECASPASLACQPDPDPSDDDRNDADETYVQMRGGSLGGLRSMADLAIDRSDSDEIIEISEEMTDALDDVLERLDELDEEWDLPLVVYDSVASVPAQAPDPDRERLNDLEGEEFDEPWVELVLESLDSAESSAETVIERGENAGLRELAGDVLNDVTEWITAVEAIAS